MLREASRRAPTALRIKPSPRLWPEATFADLQSSCSKASQRARKLPQHSRCSSPQPQIRPQSVPHLLSLWFSLVCPCILIVQGLRPCLVHVCIFSISMGAVTRQKGLKKTAHGAEYMFCIWEVQALSSRLILLSRIPCTKTRVAPEHHWM